jgi:ParB family chromosome partitioning protein
MPAKPRLQNTLAHFLDREPGAELEGARLLPLRLIVHNARQPRQVFDEARLAELAASIAEHGVIEPIVVRPDGDQYQIVAGERRYRAAGMAGLEEIPAVIREDLDEAQAALLTAAENLQREDLDIEDEGRMYDTLLAQGIAASERELARQLGIDRSRINRARRLAQVPALCQQIRSGAITLRQAVAALNDEGMAHVESTDLAERADLDAESVAHREPRPHRSRRPRPGAT